MNLSEFSSASVITLLTMLRISSAVKGPRSSRGRLLSSVSKIGAWFATNSTPSACSVMAILRAFLKFSIKVQNLRNYN